ncbi:MAG: 50S ribosomal protein L18 [Flavobacteriales bacterium]|nr:50S ribosomal protein L18 [Flavobacteriales bacterium]
MKTKDSRRLKIKKRIRRVVEGTATRPRLSVFRSNNEIYAQLVDDNSGKTLMAASSRQKSIADQKTTKSEQARLVGQAIAAAAGTAGIESVVFDRNGYLYHGRVKSLAEGAREGGLKF